MAKFVFVHGAWRGGWCWVRVAKLLRQQVHEIYTPTLTGVGERAHLPNENINLDTHIHDLLGVCNRKSSMTSSGVVTAMVAWSSRVWQTRQPTE